MSVEIRTAAELQGNKIIQLLKSPHSLRSTILHNDELTNEEGQKVLFKTFVGFPAELAKVFPGSYISPKTFLHEFGIIDEDRATEKKLLGSHVGTLEDPAFHLVDQDAKSSFSLTILNGATNKHTLAMTEYAHRGFDYAPNRARYQHHMYESIIPFLRDISEPTYGIKLFDDCIASLASAAGEFIRRLNEGDQRLSKGFELQAVTATPQAILFLRQLSKASGINFKMNIGQLSFGLTNGEKVGNVKKHSNYMTYPDGLLDLLRQIDPSIVRLLENFKVKISEEEEVIQTVGDMGVGETGIEGVDMELIREEHGDDFCPWNDTREDTHGGHPKNGTLMIPNEQTDGRPLHVYLARGGYLPYEWDRRENPHMKNVDLVIERASRVWSVEHGFGVTFNELNGK